MHTVDTPIVVTIITDARTIAVIATTIVVTAIIATMVRPTSTEVPAFPLSALDLADTGIIVIIITDDDELLLPVALSSAHSCDLSYGSRSMGKFGKPGESPARISASVGQ